MYIFVVQLEIMRLHYHARVLRPIVVDAKSDVVMMVIVMNINVIAIVKAIQLKVWSQTVVRVCSGRLQLWRHGMLTIEHILWWLLFAFRTTTTGRTCWERPNRRVGLTRIVIVVTVGIVIFITKFVDALMKRWGACVYHNIIVIVVVVVLLFKVLIRVGICGDGSYNRIAGCKVIELLQWCMMLCGLMMSLSLLHGIRLGRCLGCLWCNRWQWLTSAWTLDFVEY